MFKKSAFLACGQYVAAERHAEDYSLWGRMLLSGGVVGIPEPLLDFRVHGASISKQMAETQDALSRKIAVRHCMQFMDLDEQTATRANEALRGDRCIYPLKEWLWFLCKCLPRMRWHSLEMGAWIVSRTIQIMRQTPPTRNPGA